MSPEFQSLKEAPCIPQQAAIIVRKTGDSVEIIQDGDPFQSHDQTIVISTHNIPHLINALMVLCDG